MNYSEYLSSKTIAFTPSGLSVDRSALNPHLFDFQRDIVAWALKLGRAAIFVECGMGKTIMALSWADRVIESEGGQILILTPLAVGQQMAQEGERFGVSCRVVAQQSEIKGGDRILITNYEKLHKFDCSRFIGVVLDESSCLKAYTSATRNALIESFGDTRYKLACTATPAPNDHVELGNHAEFLGVMSRVEMLATYFVHDGGDTSKWRLKGHAEDVFWQWISSWAVMLNSPADLGYELGGYDLPPLVFHEHVVEQKLTAEDGQLFKMEAATLSERRQARRQSLGDRVQKAAELVNSTDEQWLVWCDLNDEGDALESAINGAVQVAGRHSDEHKTDAMLNFAAGAIPVLISKPSICGFGMNFQSCHNIAFVGLSDSYESMHQAIKRCHRFGQQHPVHVHVITSSAEGAVLRNIKRKESEAQKMAEEMVKHISVHQDVQSTQKQTEDYKPQKVTGLDWDLYLGDCVEVAKSLPENSIHYSIYSPPFASLYTYSNSSRDMGNCRSHDDFAEHFRFLAHELYRVLMPGRLMSFHCMNLPTSKERDGYIGITDFRGQLIRLFQECGFIFHSEVCIWKDPVTAMQRTKALGLLHKQIKKDSCMSRQGIPDYLVTMRKPGDNSEPVSGRIEYYAGDNLYNLKTDRDRPAEDRDSINIWQRYASPIWMDINPSRTLQRDSAREEKDERHICPLQLDVIERALQLWSNRQDLVFSPFAGIGSEGYVSLQMGRKFVGAELKQSYFEQACRNLESVANQRQTSLLELLA